MQFSLPRGVPLLVPECGSVGVGVLLTIGPDTR